MLAFQITHDERCTGQMSETYLDFSELALDETYNYFWRFLYRNIVTVFVPFFMLFYLNVCIVHALQQQTAVVREEINTAQRKVGIFANFANIDSNSILNSLIKLVGNYWCAIKIRCNIQLCSA